MPLYHRILAIINPAAGQSDVVKIREKIERRLEPEGIEVTVRESTGRGDTLAWSRGAKAEGFDLIMVAGGDGTIREAVEGLIRSGSRIPLAQVPAGTTNVTARALSIPVDATDAADLVLTGKAVRFDIGYLPQQDRYFVFVAGAGYDARLIQATSPILKKRIGFFAYVAAGIHQFFSIRPVRIDLEVDGKNVTMRAHTAMVINIGNIGNLGLAVGPDINPHDGRLNLMTFSAKTPFDSLRVIFKILTKRYYGYGDFQHIQAVRVRVSADPPLPVQIDGEPLGTTPFLAEVIPNAISMIVPKEYGVEPKPAKRRRRLLFARFFL